MAWVQRSCGLVKRGRKRKCKCFKRSEFDQGRECSERANIYKQSISLMENTLVVSHKNNA